MVQEKLLWSLTKSYEQSVTDGGGVAGGLVLVAAHTATTEPSSHWIHSH